MLEKLTNWALGLAVACLFALSVVGAFGQCSKPVGSPVTKQIDTVLVHRTDTLHKLDTVLKTRIKYIETVRIDTVHDILDSLIPIDTADNDGNQLIAANQLREAIKWHDSLSTCKEMRKVDSVAIDTLGKLARKVDTVKPPITQRLKDVGIGALIGIGFRSLF